MPLKTCLVAGAESSPIGIVCSVVVYDIDGLVPLCGNTAAPLAGGYANILKCANTRNDIFISAGNNNSYDMES
ncbi:hypothetical protein NPIL_74162 [Nephila pilipes]|uniref:Uncharacterized protein n=1 Tax=Nephila pilipes TaxID=299642 RepID=A0A8X6PQL6_NEPPI|nr:hypothetical protein NPIL_74162 [Nephila pilipes]